MLRKIVLLFLSVVIIQAEAIGPKITETTVKNPAVAIVKFKDQTITLYTSQLIQLMVAKLQTLAQIPSQTELQKFLTKTKKDLVALAVHYLHHSKELLENPEFMTQMLFQAMLFARDTKTTEMVSKISDSDIKVEYETKIKELPLPKQFRLKVAVFNSDSKAKQALESLESGVDFTQILKASTKEFSEGDISDPVSNSQFVSIFSPNIPQQVKVILANTTKTGLLPIITTTDSKGQSAYWVVKVLKIRDGTIADLPKLDLTNPNAKNAIARSAALTKLMKHAHDLVLKDAHVEYIEIAPAKAMQAVAA